ncbi:MAG TPA: MFS transporter [Mycobacteriales bacterium]|nr:MFS transporter [Mycobacteriales bacterium]
MSRRSLLAVMCIGYFLVLLDVSALNVALPRLRAALETDSRTLSWVISGYAVPFASLLLFGGALGDRAGHRRIVLCGLVLFGLGSAGCALAPSIGALIATRAVQGIGAAALLPGTLAVINREFPPNERTRAIGIWAAVGGLALPAGPLVGGLVLTATSWRAVFWLNVPLVAFAVLAVARLAPRDQPDPTRRVDPAGATLAALALGLLAWAAATESPWIGLGALLALGGFLLAEARVRHPMVPLPMFADRGFSVANAAAFAMNFTAQGMLFLLTLFLQNTQHRSVLAAGLGAFPAFALLVLVPPFASRLIGRYGAPAVTVGGLVLAVAGLALLLPVGAGTPYLGLVPGLLVWGAGLGLITPAVVAGATGTVPPERAGLASGLNNTARQAGNAVGVPAFAAIGGFGGAAGIAALVCAAAAVSVAASRAGRSIGAPRAGCPG